MRAFSCVVASRAAAARWALLAAALTGGPAGAAPSPGDAAGSFVAYRAARIVARPGEVFEPGVLVVRGGLVEAVQSAATPIPPGAEVVDLGGAVLLPAFVNPLSSISERTYREGSGGVTSIASRDPRDARNFAAASAVRADEPVWRRLGRSGYGAVGWLPDSSGFIAGQAAVVRPRTGRDTPQDSLVLKEEAFLLLNFEVGKRWREVWQGEMKKAADAVVKERDEKKAAETKAAEPKPEEKKADDAKGEAKKADEKPAPPKDGEKKDAQPSAARAPAPAPARPAAPPDPLVRVLRGELMMFLRIRTPAAFDHYFRIHDALPVKPKLVILTPPQPPEVIDKLARRGQSIIAVVLEPRLDAFWETSVLVNSAALFSARGIPVALVPPADSLDGFEGMPYRLGEMVKAGLSEGEALAAATVVPAKILGLEGRVGQLVRGATASFNAFDADPLAGTSRLSRAYVGGVEVYHDDLATGSVSGEAVR